MLEASRSHICTLRTHYNRPLYQLSFEAA